MNWTPDADSTVPYYIQISQHFENLILQGDLQPGSQLPAERLLAAQLGVNRSTISAAYAELRSSGLISSERGSGTRVSEDLWNVSPQKIINWNHFTGVSFLPIHPLRKRIRQVADQPGMIDLATASMSETLYPLQPVKQILQQIAAEPQLGYAEQTGDKSFRLALADHLQKHYGMNADPEEILVTTGSQQAFQLITHGLLRPGDTVLIESPSYSYRHNSFTSAGIRMVPLPLDDQGIVPEEIPALCKKYRVRMLFTNPTNQDPTGTTLPLKRRKKLLQICTEWRLPVIEMDFTGPLTHPGNPGPPQSLFQLNADSKLVIHVGSLSDTLAPGIRVGWIVGSKAVIERLAEAKYQMDRGTSSISQQIALHFLQSGYWESNLQRLKEKLSMRRKKMEKSLAVFLGERANWITPRGGNALWCKLDQPLSDAELLELGIRHGVLFDPGSIYGAKNGFVRLCHSHCAEEEIEEGIKRLGETIAAARQEKR